MSGALINSAEDLPWVKPAPRLPFRRSRWRRWVRPAILWLAVGAMLTIAVSWGCILWRVYVSVPFLGGAATPGVATGTGAPASLVMNGRWPLAVDPAWRFPDGDTEFNAFGYKRLEGWAVRYHLPGKPILTAQELLQEMNRQVALEFPPQPEFGTKLSSAERNHRQELRELRLRLNSMQLQRSTTSIQQSVFRRLSGWPALSMETRYVAMAGPDTNNVPLYVIGEEFSAEGSSRATPWQLFDRGILWSADPTPWTGTICTLPLRPTWPGFAINTIVWGGLAWLAALGVRTLRERSRLREGQCPGCRYQVNDLPVCPECGRENAVSVSPSALQHETLPMRVD